MPALLYAIGFAATAAATLGGGPVIGAAVAAYCLVVFAKIYAATHPQPPDYLRALDRVTKGTPR